MPTQATIKSITALGASIVVECTIGVDPYTAAVDRIVWDGAKDATKQKALLAQAIREVYRLTTPTPVADILIGTQITVP